MVPLVLSPRRHAALTSHLASEVPAIAGSEHFTVYCLAPAEHGDEPRPELVVVHSFLPTQIDNNLGYYVVNELLPLLMVTGGCLPAAARRHDPFAYDEQAIFEHCVGAIVRSMDGNERRAWHRFYTNSIRALERSMGELRGQLDFIEPFGAIYRHIISLIRGRTLLDAGTCFGFLPLILARQEQAEGAGRLLEEPLAQIMGCDLDTALLAFANGYAGREGYGRVRFARGDLLADDFQQLGVFDTVTAIHVLEHLDHEQTMSALANLWGATAQRLIIAVPLEAAPDARFGHRQVFNKGRMLGLGQEFSRHVQYFEHHGGWLVVDRA